MPTVNPASSSDGQTKRIHDTMNYSLTKQRGASAIISIIILAIIGAGIYIGMQYIPLYVESSSVDSILNNIEKANNRTPVKSTKDIRDMIDRQLNMNQLDDLGKNFRISHTDGEYLIEVSYSRELNLIYKKEPLKYEKGIYLR
jgi:hypothetical protein